MIFLLYICAVTSKTFIMKTNYLFSNRYKKVGWFLFIPGLILGIVFLICQSDISFFNFKVFLIAEQAIFSDTNFFSISENNVLDEISSILIILVLYLLHFQKKNMRTSSSQNQVRISSMGDLYKLCYSYTSNYFCL